MNKSCISSYHPFFIPHWEKTPSCLRPFSCFIETRNNGHLNTQGRLHQQPRKDPVKGLNVKLRCQKVKWILRRFVVGDVGKNVSVFDVCVIWNSCLYDTYHISACLKVILTQLCPLQRSFQNLHWISCGLLELCLFHQYSYLALLLSFFILCVLNCSIPRFRFTYFLKFFLWRCDPTRVMASSFTRFSRSHTMTHHSR